MRPPPRRMLRELACLRPLHRAPPPVRPGDWLDEHDEPGQSLALFRQQNRHKLTSQRRVLVAQQPGEFAPARRALPRAVARYLRAFFGLAVRINKRSTTVLTCLPR